MFSVQNTYQVNARIKMINSTSALDALERLKIIVNSKVKKSSNIETDTNSD